MDLESRNIEVEPIPDELITNSLNEAARKYVFSSYRTFHQLHSSSYQRYQSQEQGSITISDLRNKSISFRDDLGVFISELLLIENSMQYDGEMSSHSKMKTQLTRQIDMIIEFTRLFHMTEILCFQISKDDDNSGYMNVLRWLQDLCKTIPSPLDDEESAIAFEAHIQPETLFPEYWSIITFFVTQGKLVDAANLLLGHSEFKRSSQVEAQEVYAVFSTHPLANLLMDNESDQEESLSFRRVTNDWAMWR